jgi:hypothetical protein
MKIRADRIPGRSGTLYQRTKKKKLKDGSTKEYPLVSGQRQVDNVNHWFWQLTFKSKQPDGEFKSQTISVSPSQVLTVKLLIAQNTDVLAIVSYLRSST